MASNPQITSSNKQTRSNERNKNVTYNNQQRYRRNDNNRNRNYVRAGNIQTRNNSSCPQSSLDSTSQHNLIFENRNSKTQNNEVINDIKDTLYCQVCLDILQIPIYICDNGHDICKFCTLQFCTQKCHMCGSPYSKARRNKTIEDIIEMLTSPCQNSIHGCTYRNFEDTLKTHICDFQELKCPYGMYDQNCNWTGNITSLEMHFSQVHAMNFILTPGKEVLFKNFNVYKDDKNLQLIKINKSLFLYHVKIDVEKGVGNWVIQFVGSERDADNWIYEFSFYSKVTKISIRTMESCKSHNTDVKNLFTSGHCVSIPLNVLSHLLDRKGDFSFKFFIKYQPVKKNKSVNEDSVNTEQNCVQNLIDLNESSVFTNKSTPQNTQSNNIVNDSFCDIQDLIMEFNTDLTEQAALLQAVQMNNASDAFLTTSFLAASTSNDNDMRPISASSNTIQPEQGHSSTNNIDSQRNTPSRIVTHSSINSTTNHPLEPRSIPISQNTVQNTTNLSTFASNHTNTYSRPIVSPRRIQYTQVQNTQRNYSSNITNTNTTTTYSGRQTFSGNSAPVTRPPSNDCLIL